MLERGRLVSHVAINVLPVCMFVCMHVYYGTLCTPDYPWKERVFVALLGGVMNVWLVNPVETVTVTKANMQTQFNEIELHNRITKHALQNITH